MPNFSLEHMDDFKEPLCFWRTRLPHTLSRIFSDQPPSPETARPEERPKAPLKLNEKKRATGHARGITNLA
jgi:hypothetical protein